MKLQETIDLVTVALNKQEPKQVEWTPAYQSYYSAGDEAEALCPNCGTDGIEDDQKYCKDCGQALAYPWDIEPEENKIEKEGK